MGRAKPSPFFLPSPFILSVALTRSGLWLRCFFPFDLSAAKSKGICPLSLRVLYRSGRVGGERRCVRPSAATIYAGVSPPYDEVLFLFAQGKYSKEIAPEHGPLERRLPSALPSLRASQTGHPCPAAGSPSCASPAAQLDPRKVQCSARATGRKSKTLRH